MENDLISRQAAIDALHSLAHRFEDPEDWCILEGEAEFVVSQLPSAQPERKKGKWTYIKNVWVNHSVKVCRCSVCNRPSYGAMDFCARCGAEMERRDG